MRDPHPAVEHVDTFLGFDVNDFKSVTVFAIFNDPDADDILALPEALRPLLTDAPLFVDESERRVRDHARLMNEDRAQLRPHRSPVIVRRQTTLQAPWVTLDREGENE